MSDPPLGTVTLLFTDIEGSTRLLQRTGDAYADLLADHRRLLRAVFVRHAGHEVEVEGDSFFVVFASAAGAVAAAADAQRRLAQHAWPGGNEIRVRMGLHTGEPRIMEAGYVGVDVHRAARVMAAGHGGQVLVSESTRALLDDRSRLRDLGEHRLKDLSEPQRLYQLQIEGLPVEFPPLRTLENRPTNLPAQPNVFIGRADEIEQVQALLSRDGLRLLTLTGPGGTGKTRLALQVAADLVERFANGVFFVPLAPIQDAALVVPTIADTLGLRQHSGESVEETLKEYLRDQQLLLLLDNFEHIAAAAPSVAELLASAPGLKVLATSRSPLNLSGETVYAVPSLALPDLARLPDTASLALYESVSLFVERARAAAPDFGITDGNAHAIAAICVRLDGLPLAIELAASRVRTLPPAALLLRLDRRLELLTEGARDLDERQQTLRATIDWSYDLLTEAEKALFVRLAVLVGGFRIEAAEALRGSADECGLGALDGLGSLLEKSLLRQRADPDGEPRFWMLETIREYAFEMLVELGAADDVARLHALYFLSLAEQADLESRTGDQSDSFARLDAENANLRAAIGWARKTGERDVMLRLVTALWGFWATRGHVTEGTHALEDALERTAERPARALLGRCALQLLAGTSDELLPAAREALAACEQLGDEYSLAQAWNLLGRVEGTVMGAMASAEDAWRNALSYAERNNFRAERAESAGWLMVSAIFGPLPADEGIARCEQFYGTAGDDPAMRAFCLVERAVLEAMRGRFTVARELLAEGSGTVEELGLKVWAANNAQETYLVEMLAGDPRAASRALRDSYATLEQMGERVFLSTIAGFLAHALCAEEAYDEAARFSEASEEASSRDDVHSQVLWRTARAKVYARRGELEGALVLAREAVELVEKTDFLNTHADALFDLGEVLAVAGRPGDARAAIEESARRYAQKGNLPALDRARRRADDLVTARSPSQR